MDYSCAMYFMELETPLYCSHQCWHKHELGTQMHCAVSTWPCGESGIIMAKPLAEDRRPSPYIQSVINQHVLMWLMTRFGGMYTWNGPSSWAYSYFVFCKCHCCTFRLPCLPPVCLSFPSEVRLGACRLSVIQGLRGQRTDQMITAI